jgi:hypothetical protein
MENADAALVMATADATGRTNREHARRRPTESLPVVLTVVNNAVEILCNKIGVVCFKS